METAKFCTVHQLISTKILELIIYMTRIISIFEIVKAQHNIIYLIRLSLLSMCSVQYFVHRVSCARKSEKKVYIFIASKRRTVPEDMAELRDTGITALLARQFSREWSNNSSACELWFAIFWGVVLFMSMPPAQNCSNCKKNNESLQAESITRAGAHATCCRIW